jgi:hypothetical protein
MAYFYSSQSERKMLNTKHQSVKQYAKKIFSKVYHQRCFILRHPRANSYRFQSDFALANLAVHSNYHGRGCLVPCSWTGGKDL